MKGLLVSHTHWDREWYLSFEEYRARFLRVLKRALELLSSGRMRFFTLDGQSSLIEDYLEVYPEDRRLVSKLVREGKLLIGPWYTQPDEFLVSGESLIRNLLTGMKVAEELGGCMKVGYLPDTFGHTAQLPQVLRGFSLSSFVFTRGLGDEGEQLKPVFKWRAPDGSWVLALNLVYGYWHLTLPGARNWAPVLWEAPGGWKTVYYPAYIEGVDTDVEEAAKRLRKALEEASVYPACSLLMHGCDHRPPQPLGEALEKLREMGAEVEEGTLEEYLKALAEAKLDLKIYEGELRGARYFNLLPGVLSARPQLKRLNYTAQLLLEKYAEPLSTINWLLGFSYPSKLLEAAWKLLLKCHAHDSICGCGTDPVAREVEARLEKAIGLASSIAFEAALQLASRTAAPRGELCILVFNPLPYPREEVVEAFIPREAFKPMAAAKGELTGVQLLEEDASFGGHVKIAFKAKAPPLGYRVYTLAEGEQQGEQAPAASRWLIENEWVAAGVRADGALELLDKASGKVYWGLAFISEGDVGDEYTYCPPERNMVYTSLGKLHSLRVEKGCAKQILKLEYRMLAPEKAEGNGRSSKLVELPIRVEAAVPAGSKRVELKVTVWNTARDHRLRVLFDTGIKGSKVHADTHFHIAERSRTPPKGEGWVEKPASTQPMLTWVDLSDGKRGFMVAARGVHEYEAKPSGELLITLYRAVSHLSKAKLETRRRPAGPLTPTPGAQCLREMTFELAVIPHSGDWRSSIHEALAYTTPLTAIAFKGKGGELPLEKSFLQLPRELILTALKRSEDSKAIVARAYNPLSKPVKLELKLGFKATPHEANLREEPTGPLGEEVKPHKIITVRLEPEAS